MSKIERVKDEAQGPIDGVKLLAKAVITRFITNRKKGTVTIKGQETVDCKIMASYQAGTVSISVPERALLVSVRLDEMMAVLQEASRAAMEHAGPVRPREGGPHPLYCAKCRCWVPDTASPEMKELGFYSHKHTCGDLTHGEIPDQEGQDE